MKKYLLLSVFAIAIASFISCQDNIDPLAPTDSQEETSSHTIPVDQALENLKDFLNDNPKTRSLVDGISLTNVITVRTNHIHTRATNLPEDCNTLMYAVNFSDENGYALLSADNRIEDAVIAVTSEGSISQNDIEAAKADLDDSQETVFEDYPTTGDGLISIPEYPNEKFLNPNTFNPYDSVSNDSWIGDFSEDNIGEEDENGNLIDNAAGTRATSLTQASACNRKVMAMCLSYAVDEVFGYETGGGGGGSNFTSTRTTYGSWTDVIKRGNILSSYYSWQQNSPFNDMFPRRRKFLIFGHRRKVPAGCFPLALAKVLTHFQYPSVFRYNGEKVDWNSVNNVYFSDTGRHSAAVLLKGIADWCGCWYFYAGTFTIPSHASSFLKDIGLSNVKRLDYKYDRVTAMIDKGCPVIIYAMPGIKITSSHAWIIDGYKIKTRDNVITRFQNGKVVSTKTESETSKMVHCDFGWGGKCNGYFVDGIFKLNNSENEFDNNNHNGNTNYNHHKRIIVYDNPNN